MYDKMQKFTFLSHCHICLCRLLGNSPQTPNCTFQCRLIRNKLLISSPDPDHKLSGKGSGSLQKVSLSLWQLYTIKDFFLSWLISIIFTLTTMVYTIKNTLLCHRKNKTCLYSSLRSSLKKSFDDFSVCSFSQLLSIDLTDNFPFSGSHLT